MLYATTTYTARITSRTGHNPKEISTGFRDNYEEPRTSAGLSSFVIKVNWIYEGRSGQTKVGRVIAESMGGSARHSLLDGTGDG
ncbi:hypothetical protein OG21DRAFT_1506987 [Imleria badia]|nr:hypothetical protein OG21DRAFT_1506987 [Imleria badia]